MQSITQQVYLTMFIEDENITTCFGLIRPLSSLHPKGIRDSVTTMRLYKDGEISSSGYSYVIIKIKIKNLVGEGGFINVGLC